LAGYQFESFASGYPKIEEAAYLEQSYTIVTSFSLDQTDTFKAIDKLQAFIDTYPNSFRIFVDANEAVSFERKNREKVYENARI
jgi:outer membrane protein assembly factor BamD